MASDWERRHRGDFRLEDFDRDNPPYEPRVSPGKRTLTSQLVGPDEVHVQLDDPEAARAFAEVVAGPRAGVAGALERAEDTPGRPLPGPLQGELEDSLGADLSGVRVHSGAGAHDAAVELDASAFTHGRDIYFRGGAYDPGSPEGHHLIAHEVAHTVQQGNAAAPSSGAELEISQPGDLHEREAESFAGAFARGESATVSPVRRGSVSRAVVQRERYGRTQVTPGDSDGSKKPTQQQIAKLSELQPGVESLQGCADAVNQSVADLLSEGEAAMKRIDAALETLGERYREAFQKHEAALTAIGEDAKQDEAITNAVVGVAIAVVSPHITAAWGVVSTAEAVFGKAAAETAAISFIAGQAQGKATAAVKGAAQEGAGLEAGDGASALKTSLPSFRQLQLVQQVSELKDAMFSVAKQSVDLKPVDQAASTLVRDIAMYVELGKGTSVSDPVDVVISKGEQLATHGVAAYEYLQKLAQEDVGSVEAMADAMQGAVDECTVSELERRIWVEWLATRDPSKDLDQIDRLEGNLFRGPYLPREVLDMLGVDTGSVTSDSDLLSIHYNARWAQRAGAQVGKDGNYSGAVSPSTYKTGRVWIGHDDFPAQIQAVGDALGNFPDGQQHGLPVVVIGTYTTGADAGPGAGHLESKERFGLRVQIQSQGGPSVQY